MPSTSRAFDAAYRSDGGYRGYTADEIAVNKSGDELWIAQESSEIIAYCRINLGPKLVWVKSLAVHPEYHGRGIGTALAFRALSSLGVGRDRLAGLTVSSTNSSTKAVYERLGFTSRREERRFGTLRNDLLVAMARRHSR